MLLAEARRCPECGDQVTVALGWGWVDDAGEPHLFVYKCYRCSRENGMDSMYGYNAANELVRVDPYPVEE